MGRGGGTRVGIIVATLLLTGLVRLPAPAQQAAVDKTAADVALRVREAYYGLLLAHELRAHLADLYEQLLKAADREETLVEGGFASEQDLFKLRTFEGELQKNLNLSQRLQDTAQEALRVWTG